MTSSNVDHMMQSLERNILKYFRYMTQIQKEVYKEYTADKDFKFDQLENMDVHVNVCNLLAKKWSKTSISQVYKDAKEIYFDLYRSSSTFSQKSKTKLAEYGRVLTGIMLVNGDNYLGLTFAVSVLELVPLDSYMFVVVAKWSCQLREFDIFEKYNDLFLEENFVDVETVLNVCQMYSQFFKTWNFDLSQLEIVDRLIAIKNDLLKNDEISDFCNLALMLISNLLGHAAKLPNFDIEKYGDMIKHFDDERAFAFTMAKTRFKELKSSYGKPLLIYDFDEMPDSHVFLKNVMSITDYHDTEISYAKIMLQHGCIQESEQHFISILYYGTLLATPFRVLQPLNALYDLKFRTINDRDKLKGFGAMIVLLLGSSVSSGSGRHIRLRNLLLKDSYKFKHKHYSESILKKDFVSETRIYKHPNECECFICYESSSNERLYAEKQFSNFLNENMPVHFCSNFYSNQCLSDLLCKFKSIAFFNRL